jgi:hypothetical protein
LQASFAEQPDRDKANGAHHHEVALGSKQEDGMTIFGSRDEVTLAFGEKRIAEHWDSELGFFLRWTDTHPATGSIEIRTLTNLRRVEPDPKLFVIPAEYLPHADPLLDATKVFIDNQTGIPEITDGAADVFKAWGSMAVTDRQDDADLVAVFTNVLMDGPETNEFPIKMGIYTPHSNTILFTSHLVKNMKSQPSAYSSHQLAGIAKGCVVDLWNRIANTRIGPVQSVSVATTKVAPSQP